MQQFPYGKGNTVKAEQCFGLHVWSDPCFCLAKGVFGFCAVELPTSLGGRAVQSAASRRALGRVASWKLAARKPEEP